MIGPSPRLMRAMLDRHAKPRADGEDKVYVRPHDALGSHVVKELCSGVESVVAGPVGQTFKPGSVVRVVSTLGSQSKVMMAYPPPGSRGASGFQADVDGGSIEVPAACPVQVTGHDYLGVIFDDTTDPPRLRMRQYRDGTVGSWIGGAWTDWPPAYSEPSYAGAVPGFGAITGTKVAVVVNTNVTLVVWDYIAATLSSVVVATGVSLVSGPVAAGGYFWLIAGSDPAQLYRIDPDTLDVEVIGEDTVYGPLWAMSASQIYSLETGTQYLARSFGGDGTSPWVIVGSSAVEFTGQDAGGAIGVDARLVQSYAGEIFNITPSLPPASASTVTPAHWAIPSAPQTLWATPGGGGVVCFSAGTPAAFTRLDATRDYASVRTRCSMPSTAIDNDPDTDIAPVAFFPSN